MPAWSQPIFISRHQLCFSLLFSLGRRLEVKFETKNVRFDPNRHKVFSLQAFLS